MEERVHVKDVDTEEYWYVAMDFPALVGHTLVIASAPKGVHHEVLEVVHHVGFEHRVDLLVRKKR
jgi:hypothetical protein